jgi:hypothetical protein
VIVTNHSDYDWHQIARDAPLVVDTRNALGGVAVDKEKVFGL